MNSTTWGTTNADVRAVTGPSDHVRQASWLPWLTMLVVGGAFYATEHDPLVSLADAFTETAEEMQQRVAGGDTVRRLVYPTMGLFGVACVLTSPWFAGTNERRRIDLLLLTPLVAYLAWCSASVVWSDEPSLTVKRLVVMFCVVAGAAGAASRLRPADLMLVAAVVPTVFLCIGILSELRLGTFRPWAGDYRFSGTLHPNAQGISLACLCLSSAGLIQIHRRWRPLFVGLFLFGFTFVLLTKSRTSAAGLILAVSAYWTITTPLRTKLLLGFVGTWCGVAVLFTALLAGTDVGGSASDAALLGREEQASSLTGRLPIWTELAPHAAARPILGHGYEAFWTAEHITKVSEELHWGIREAHSTFLDAILAVGLVGMSIALVATLVGAWRCQVAYSESGHPLYGMLLAMSVFGLVNACTESAMLVPAFYTFVLGTGLIFTATRSHETAARANAAAESPSGGLALAPERLTVSGNPML